jgi:hypothetical protein
VRCSDGRLCHVCIGANESRYELVCARLRGVEIVATHRISCMVAHDMALIIAFAVVLLDLSLISRFFGRLISKERGGRAVASDFESGIRRGRNRGVSYLSQQNVSTMRVYYCQWFCIGL